LICTAVPNVRDEVWLKVGLMLRGELEAVDPTRMPSPFVYRPMKATFPESLMDTLGAKLCKLSCPVSATIWRL
jgi:hypothetical protein